MISQSRSVAPMLRMSGRQRFFAFAAVWSKIAAASSCERKKRPWRRSD
jgi:hypothetical protein